MEDWQPITVRRAEGCYLETDDGRRLFDGVSSLWCNVHGHNHPHINAAIAEQLAKVAHVPSLGLSCDVTERLAVKLAEITPGDLTHTFFGSDGASAIESALKMAFQYWKQCDNPQPGKTNYLALGSAYHGDTTGAVSLGGIKSFHRMFGPLLFQPVRGPIPCTTRFPNSVQREDLCDHYAGQFESLLAEHHESLAAVVLEPLVQGAAGMITHPPGLLSAIAELCERFNVLLICDEVAVGFGRTGRLFACEHEDVTPDILCLGKGLTGGYLPMAATVARPKVFDAFLAPASHGKQFFHGHTFGGNPLAAAAALASIELFDHRDSGDTDLVGQVNHKSKLLRDALGVLRDHPNVAAIRGRGLMVGIEIVADRHTLEPHDPSWDLGRRVCDAAIRRGIWLRPLGDVIVAMPPLVSTESQLIILARTIVESIEEVLADPEGLSDATV